MFDNAWIYDLETQGFTDDLPYWKALLDEYRPARVLDIACGTGRMTFPLADHGWAQNHAFRITGLDKSAPFLARARERLTTLDVERANAIQFVEGDMRDFDLGETFDLILIGFNSLAYVYELDDQLACLKAVRRHLAPHGRFAIDLLVPQLSFLSEAETPVPIMRRDLDIFDPSAGITRLVRFATERYNAETQIDDTVYYYDIYHADGRCERFTSDLPWHMYFPRELTLLLRLAGLEPVQRYGTYARTPFNPESKQYLWVMRPNSPHPPAPLSQ